AADVVGVRPRPDFLPALNRQAVKLADVPLAADQQFDGVLHRRLPCPSSECINDLQPVSAGPRERIVPRPPTSTKASKLSAQARRPFLPAPRLTPPTRTAPRRRSHARRPRRCAPPPNCPPPPQTRTCPAAPRARPCSASAGSRAPSSRPRSRAPPPARSS